LTTTHPFTTDTLHSLNVGELSAQDRYYSDGSR
jgi:hypothetical protein